MISNFLGTIVTISSGHMHFLNGMFSFIHTLIGSHDNLCDNGVYPANRLMD